MGKNRNVAAVAMQSLGGPGQSTDLSLLEDLRHKTLLAQKQASRSDKVWALLCHFQNLVFNERSKKQQEKSLKGLECIAWHFSFI